MEAIAKKRADDQNGGLYEFSSGVSMVRVPPVQSIMEQEGVRGGRDKYYLSQSAIGLLKDLFELNSSTHLDPSHPATTFCADQIIQLARALGLRVSLASLGKLEDLLLTARVGGGDRPVESRYSVAGSSFLSVAGSSWGDSVASKTNSSLPTVTETDAYNVVAVEVSLQEPCSSKQVDAGLAAGHAIVRKLVVTV